MFHLPNLFRCPNALPVTFFLDQVDPNDTFAPFRSPPLCFLGGMRRSPRFPVDKSFEGSYTCVHCNERFTSVFAHVPSDAFSLYDVKGKKLCCQGCWEKMMMRVSEHLALLSTPKPRRSTSASSGSSSATLPEPVDTPPTISGGSGEIEEDVELDCDGCGKHPSQRMFDVGSHYFTETNTIRRYYMGLPVLPDAVRLCWGCQQDMLKMRRHIGQVCKRRTGEDTILTDSVQLPAPCVSPIVLRKHEKSKKRKRELAGSQMSAPQTEVPVHKVAKTLFHVNVNTKASQTDAMHARCTVPDTIRMLLGQLQAIHDVAANQVSEVYKLCTDGDVSHATSPQTAQRCLIEASLTAFELFVLEDIHGCKG